MDLMWWPVAAAGLGCLVVVVVLALVLPPARARGGCVRWPMSTG